MAGPRVVLRGAEVGREGVGEASANSLALVDAEAGCGWGFQVETLALRSQARCLGDFDC